MEDDGSYMGSVGAVPTEGRYPGLGACLQPTSVQPALVEVAMHSVRDSLPIEAAHRPSKESQRINMEVGYRARHHLAANRPHMLPC